MNPIRLSRASFSPRQSRIGTIMLLAIILALVVSLAPSQAIAVPGIPTTFYGTVTKGGVSYPVGTVVGGWIGGILCGQGSVSDIGGTLLYVVDVAGDDNGTPAKDCGVPGDVVEFRVGTETATETGTWVSAGATVERNLTVPLAAASIASVTPDNGDPGATLNVTIVGSNTNFAQGVTTASFGAGVTVNSVTVQSPTQLVVGITVSAGATSGTRTVSVTTNTQVVTQTDGFTVNAAAVSITLPSGFLGASGSQVLIPVTLPASVTGKNILSWELEVTFDASVLSPVDSFTVNTLSASGWTVADNVPNAGQINVAAFSTQPLAGSGVLIFLRFNVIGAGGEQSNLTFARALLNNGAPAVTTTNGSLTVSNLGIAGNVRYGTTQTAVPSAALALSGSATDSRTTGADGLYSFASLAAGSYTVIPSKTGDLKSSIVAADASRIVRCVVGELAATDCPLAAGDIDLNGLIQAFDAARIAQYLVAIANADTARVGTWIFTPPSRVYSSLSASQSGQDYQAWLIGDVSGNWATGGVVTSSVNPDEALQLPAATRQDGSFVTTAALNLPATSVYAFQMEIAFDQAAAEFESADVAPGLGSDWTIEANVGADGILRVVGYGVDPVVTYRPVALLTFTSLGAQQTLELDLQRLILNEELLVGMPSARILLPIAVR